MKIEHIALWVHDLEGMRIFYETYFEAKANDKYTNPNTGFTSYFLSFAEGARLEIMSSPAIREQPPTPFHEVPGYAHLAIAVGSEDAVDALTERLRDDGYRVIGEPRRTGDGYYESVVLDPESNRIEITV